MSDTNPAEVTWKIMSIAKDQVHADTDSIKNKLGFTDPNQVRWIKFLAKNDLIEIIDNQGLIGIISITANGALILNKVPNRETWIKVIGPIIEAGDLITLKAIEERRWYRRLFKAIKEVLALIRR
jgi:hypothetical protein